MATFYCKLTDVGAAKLADAIANQTVIELVEMAVGDGNGAHYEPTGEETELKNECYRGVIEHFDVIGDANHQVLMQMTIPIDKGGFFIREGGLYDIDGDLFAIAKMPLAYKAEVSEGSPDELTVRFIKAVESADNISIIIDESTVYATMEYVKENTPGKMESIGNILYGTLQPDASISGDLPVDSYATCLSLGISFSALPNEYMLLTCFDADGVSICNWYARDSLPMYILPSNARSISVLNKTSKLMSVNCSPTLTQKNYWNLK
ncbi:phage tail protein [Vibrio sp. YMD68]|uniref:phage tail protein n=1 Tax=Vibrio sp. YMD68 TaxID=3042300 RepID=UPI00249BAD93|nr:phage tail protein [Vibrio sp. YMD68]WGV98822.1 phage tail protein [Vibrio sp. YMD68]WGW01251.1 phage tail protein [Vibrio sp. YMD68]